MSETPRLGLPLLAPSQAQKHVTVNEALARVDALAQLVLKSRSIGVPPAGAEGDCYAVPAGASGEWSGHAGKVAVFLNGGWDFIAPAAGWRGWIADEGTGRVFNGTDWVGGVLSTSPHGAGALWKVTEIDHAVGAGASSTTAILIPEKAMVFGVTARVVTPISGSATSWRLGHPDAQDRYGSGLGVGAGSWSQGLLSQPMTYWNASSLTLSAEGGVFSGGGVVRIAAHFLELTLPSV